MIYVWCEYICIMYDCMISYVYEYWCIYDYMVVWVHVLYVIWCVVLCEIVSVLYIYIYVWLCVYSVRDMIWWYQIDIYMCDMILWLMLMYVIYADFGRDTWLEFLYVVLNTTCNCIWRYIVWILMLCYMLNS